MSRLGLGGVEVVAGGGRCISGDIVTGARTFAWGMCGPVEVAAEFQGVGVFGCDSAEVRAG